MLNSSSKNNPEPDQNKMDAVILEVLRESKLIALVGASHKMHRDSYQVMAFLQKQGYRVIPVNPARAGTEILGEAVMGSLSEIKLPIDLVDIFRNSEAAAGVVDEAIAVKAKAVWMQIGVVNQEAAAKARQAGLSVVMDRCPMIELRNMPTE